MKIFTAFLLATGCLAFAGAQERVFELSPAQTHIDFFLPAMLHTVHGTFQLKRGMVGFDPATGKASGEVIVDATSGETGNSSRDNRMHKSILETAQYPEIIFRPDHFEGKIPAEGAVTLQVHGVFSIHGKDHEVTLPVEAQVGVDQISATFKCSIPYVKWGIKNPSTFLLRVSEKADIEIHAAGHLAPSPGSVTTGR